MGRINKNNMLSTNRRAKLVGICVLAFLLFNFPLMGIFQGGLSDHSFPLPFVYLFSTWGVTLFLVWWTSREKKNHKPQ